MSIYFRPCMASTFPLLPQISHFLLFFPSFISSLPFLLLPYFVSFLFSLSYISSCLLSLIPHVFSFISSFSHSLFLLFLPSTPPPSVHPFFPSFFLNLFSATTSVLQSFLYFIPPLFSSFFLFVYPALPFSPPSSFFFLFVSNLIHSLSVTLFTSHLSCCLISFLLVSPFPRSFYLPLFPLSLRIFSPSFSLHPALSLSLFLLLPLSLSSPPVSLSLYHAL